MAEHADYDYDRYYGWAYGRAYDEFRANPPNKDSAQSLIRLLYNEGINGRADLDAGKKRTMMKGIRDGVMEVFNSVASRGGGSDPTGDMEDYPNFRTRGGNIYPGNWEEGKHRNAVRKDMRAANVAIHALLPRATWTVCSNRKKTEFCDHIIDLLEHHTRNEGQGDTDMLAINRALANATLKSGENYSIGEALAGVKAARKLYAKRGSGPKYMIKDSKGGGWRSWMGFGRIKENEGPAKPRIRRPPNVNPAPGPAPGPNPPVPNQPPPNPPGPNPPGPNPPGQSGVGGYVWWRPIAYEAVVANWPGPQPPSRRLGVPNAYVYIMGETDGEVNTMGRFSTRTATFPHQHPGTPVQRTATTFSDGSYTITGLEPGRYRMWVEHPEVVDGAAGGFYSSKVVNVTISGGRGRNNQAPQTRQNFELVPMNINEARNTRSIRGPRGSRVITNERTIPRAERPRSFSLFSGSSYHDPAAFMHRIYRTAVLSVVGIIFAALIGSVWLFFGFLCIGMSEMLPNPTDLSSVRNRIEQIRRHYEHQRNAALTPEDTTRLESWERMDIMVTSAMLQDVGIASQVTTGFAFKSLLRVAGFALISLGFMMSSLGKIVGVIIAFIGYFILTFRRQQNIESTEENPQNWLQLLRSNRTHINR